MVAFEVLAIPVVHDAVWVIERAVEIRPLVATEHVVLDPIKVPVVGWSRQVPYHLMVVGTQYSKLVPEEADSHFSRYCVQT